MGPSRNPSVRLAHIRDEIRDLGFALTDVDYAGFARSYVLSRTTEHALLIVSEAAKALPHDLTDRYPEIAWNDIRGIGNVLRHEYASVDPRVLWDTATRHLPVLAPVIDRMIAERPH